MPKPKTVQVVCDTCGLDWKLHKSNQRGSVGLSECVRLLKTELASRPRNNPWTFYQSSGSTAQPINLCGVPMNNSTGKIQ